MKYRVFILAAGSSKRWTGPVQKQLVSIGGISLITRTIDQVRDIFGVEPYIVTTDPEIALYGLERHVPVNYGYVIETLFSTMELWSDRVIVLLGDTYYTNYVLLQLREDSRPIVFYGRLLEIYAISFNDYLGMSRALKTAVVQTKHVDAGVNLGKLWSIWYVLNGYLLNEHTMPAKDNRYFQQIDPDDMTMDIDYWEDYIKLLRALKVNV